MNILIDNLKQTSQAIDDPLEPVCPNCGGPCEHTLEEMQGFGYDALEQASKDFKGEV